MKWSARSPFWLGSFLAIVGSNLAVSASVLNLYRISQTAKPIFLMMFIEAIVPILSIKIIMSLFQKHAPNSLFGISALIGTLGALTQSSNVSSLNWQIAGIALTALAASIHKPLMMQLAVKISNEEQSQQSVNNTVTFVNYAGLLVGYLLAGLLITYLGYRACFLLNALCFALFAALSYRSDFLKVKNTDALPPPATATAAPRDFDNRLGLVGVFALSVGTWLTGGSINVLEVPFAQKMMQATEFMVTLLFLFTALGAIAFSFFSERKKLRGSLGALLWSSAIMGLAILFYVWQADFRTAILLLFMCGFASAAQNFMSMELVQKYSSRKNLSKFSVYLNTTNQIVTLGAAGIGVLIAEEIGEQKTCMAFAFLTLVVVLLTALYLRVYRRKLRPEESYV